MSHFLNLFINSKNIFSFMRKIFLMFTAAVFVLFTACQKEESNTELIASTDALKESSVYPFLYDAANVMDATTETEAMVLGDTVKTKIQDYLKKTYANGVWTPINKDKDGTYTVIVKTKDGKTFVVVFDKDGNFVKETLIPNGNSGGSSADSTVIKIKNYLTGKYPNATYGNLVKNSDGTYSIAIKDKDGKVIVVTFDKNGNFIKEVVTSTGGGGTGGGGGSVDSTLIKIKTYLGEKYPNASFGDVKKNPDGTYSVTVKNKDGKVVVVTFDKNGNFIKEVVTSTGGGTGGGGSVDSTLIKIKTYLGEKYPNASFGDVKKNPDGTYSVTVKNKDGKVVVVTFDKNGNFIKEVVTSTGNTTATKIKEYLSTNYKDAKVGDIKKNLDGTYTVKVKTADGKTFTLYFDKDGNFVKAVESTNNGNGTVELPSAATDYIKTTYPTGTMVGKPKQNKDGSYIVMIKTNNGVVVIVFDKDGKVVKEYKKK
jgi:hypothetical protein